LSPRERAAIAIAIIDNNFSDYSVNYFDFIPYISIYKPVSPPPLWQ